MIAPPSACSGVSTSARKSALPMAVSNGSRFMNSAVRNGPMRTVEANTPMSPVVTAALSAMSASQPVVVAGGCQFQVASAAITNTTVEETSEYQVMRSASAPERSARVTSRITTRQRAAPRAARMPAAASVVGCAPIISASPRKAAMAAAAAPRDLLETACRRRQSGKQRIDEVGEDRDRHLDRLDCREQQKHVAGEEEAETEGNPLRARGKSDGRRNELEPGKQHRDAKHGTHGRHGEHMGAVDEHDFAQHVGAGERGGAEQGRADLRQTAAGVGGRELSQNGAYAVAGRAVRASVAKR